MTEDLSNIFRPGQNIRSLYHRFQFLTWLVLWSNRLRSRVSTVFLRDIVHHQHEVIRYLIDVDDQLSNRTNCIKFSKRTHLNCSYQVICHVIVYVFLRPNWTLSSVDSSYFKSRSKLSVKRKQSAYEESQKRSITTDRLIVNMTTDILDGKEKDVSFLKLLDTSYEICILIE